MKRYIVFFMYLCSKTKFIFTLVLFCCSLVMMGQLKKTISLHYNLSDFTFGVRDSMYYISPSNPDYTLLADTTAPALPYFNVYVLIEPHLEYQGHVISYNESLVKSNINLAPNPRIIPTNATTSSVFPTSLTYNSSEYPSSPITYEMTFVSGGNKILAFSVCPFRYDALNKQLFFKEYFTIDISLNSIQNITTDSDNNSTIRKMVRRLIVNPSDLSLPNLAHQKVSSLVDSLNYEYLIVTCDSMKPEFLRLANWKTMKGVRAKVITIEEIQNTGLTGTLQQKIKQAISDYYEGSNHRLQYVLLGGDHNIVPTELCHIVSGSYSHEAATDLFYASLKDINWDRNGNGLSGEVSDHIDFTPDIIVTRISAETRNEALIQVHRILHYEQNPDIRGWNNRILLGGACLIQRYHYPDGYITDTHYKAERYLYNNCILPYWQDGIRYKLYDTGSSFEGDALYDFNVNNLQEQFSRGYTFVNIDTHGEFDNWKMEYKHELTTFYKNQDANNMENPKANTIITTTACLTNDYTKPQPCLSECFMRNPNSGIIGYYGCSKEGWSSSDSIAENPSLKYDRKMYECLFRSDHHQLGKAIYESKMFFSAQCSYYGPMRWLMFGLNALCDPEMPVFLSLPKKFTNIQISQSANSIIVDTGGVPDCRICMMSCDDGGQSFYEVKDSVSTSTFGVNNNAYYVCVTKVGYIPYIALVGNSVYLQNQDIEYDLHIFANNTIIGNNVIPFASTGDVNILEGNTSVHNTGKVIVPRGFKVNKGATFAITH